MGFKSIGLILFLVVTLPFTKAFTQEYVAKENSKQVNLPNNQGTVNISYNLGKSQEYQSLQKQLTDLDTKITKKITFCTKLNKPDLQEQYAYCNKELSELNAEQDSIKKIEKQFKEDVLKLAATFSNTKINSDRLRKAKALFDDGKINEVHFVLNDKEMTAEGDALLLKKENFKTQSLLNDSLLKVKAAEFKIKAEAKATDYSDPLRIDSTTYCYTQSLKYYDDVQTLYDFADFLKDNQLYEKAKETYPKIIAHPNVLDWQKANAYEALGTLWKTTGNLNEAMNYFTKYYEAYVELFKKDSSTTYKKQNLGIALERLGSTHTSLGNLDKALGFYEEYLKLSKELYATYLNNVSFKNSLAISYEKLGETHTSLGNLEKALGFYEEDLKLSKELYAAYPNNVSFKNSLAISFSKLGETHTSLGNLDKALGFYEEMNKLLKELYAAYPNNVSFKNGLAVSFSKLGETHTSLGYLEKALGFYEEDNKLETELYVAYPNNVSFKNGLAVSFSKLGETHTSLGNLEKALEFYEEETKLFKELYAAYPNNVDFKNGLAISFEKLGETHTSLGNLEKALGFYEEYNRLEKELYAAYPNNVEFKNVLAISFSKLGSTHTSLRYLEKALGFYEEETKLSKELYAAYPNNVSFKNGLAILNAKLGVFCRDNLKNKVKAQNYFKQAEKIWIELVHDAPQFVDYQKYLKMVQKDLEALK